MEKFIQNDIKTRTIERGSWLSSINNIGPIAVVLTVSILLSGIAIANYCYPSCQLF